MHKLVLSLSVLLCLVHGQSMAQHPGDVLSAYIENLSPNPDTIHCIKVQPDGKLVAAGNSYKGSYMVIAVERYLDPSFGINGIAITSMDSAHTAANAMELQQDGKIVVAGGYKKGTAGDFILVRYKTDGSPDSSFGTNGIVRTDIAANSFDVATALAIQTDGKIVAAGRSGSLMALCRYNADGSLDSSFDSDGKLITAAAGATCMKLQTDGKIVVGARGVVVRLMPDGSPDYSFGTNASAMVNGRFYGMAIQNDGKILVSGDSSSAFLLIRLDTTGGPDHSFGYGGVVYAGGFGPPGASNGGQGATSVCLQADGRIIAAGWVQFSLSAFKTFAVARFLRNGSPDSSFGQNGVVVAVSYNYPFGDNWHSVAYSAAINNNGELVLAGTYSPMSTGAVTWAMVNYYLGPMLSVHSVPGVEGQITVSPNPAEDFARIQATHIENGTWRLSLCDLTGKSLYSEKLVVTTNAFDKGISLTGLPAAMYLVKLENGNSRMTVRLVKSR